MQETLAAAAAAASGLIVVAHPWPSMPSSRAHTSYAASTRCTLPPSLLLPPADLRLATWDRRLHAAASTQQLAVIPDTLD